MIAPNVVIEKMLTIDDTGMPQAPTIRQLQDKDVALLWQRDTSKDKRRYIGDVGVIYYLGDPKSPTKQQGLSDAESLKMAIDNFNLPKDYTPDSLVSKLINKYYISNITEAGVALEALRKSIHLISIAAVRINEQLNRKLSGALADEDITSILTMMDAVSKRIAEIPALTKALGTAYENLRNEEEEQLARGGKQILSSMDADDN
ncbi:MAG: hypothetical protein [Bacteriophage sp.]|nr:MAG: hypothetical protein [Bacteriophage sp.]